MVATHLIGNAHAWIMGVNMAKFIVRRILWMFLVLFAISLITFGLMRAIPGGPFTGEKRLPAETLPSLTPNTNSIGPCTSNISPLSVTL